MKKLNIFFVGLTLFFLQSYLFRFSIAGYPTNLLEILIGVSALTFLLAAISERKLLQYIKNLRNHWVVLSLVLLTLVSLALTNVQNELDLFRHLKFSAFALIFTLVFLESLPKNEDRKAMVALAGIGALLFGLFSVVYNVLGYNVAHDLRLTGPLDSAVYLAFYLTPFFIFFAVEYLEHPRTKLNLLFAILLGLLLVATKSMGAIGASFVILAFALYKKNSLPFFRSKIGKSLIVLAGLVVLAGIFYTKILPTLQTGYSSLDERGEIWQTSIVLLQEPKNLIFGLGLGQFESNYINTVPGVLGHPPLDYFVIQPHNIFLLFIFHYGLLGLAFLLLIMVKTVKHLWKLKKGDHFDLATMAAFMVAYFFIHGLIDTPIYKNDLLLIFVVLLEIALVKKIQD